MNTLRKKPSRRGFNLVEAAIVLGVVGLVIGGIWVAASAVTDNLKLSRTVTGVLSVTARMREVFKASDQPASVNTDLNPFLPAMKIVPDDWPQVAGLAQHPLGTDFAIYLESAASGEPPSFIMYLDGLSKANCIKLVAAIASRFASISGDLLDVGIDTGAGVVSYNMPTTISPTNNECYTSTAPGVTFRFALNAG